MAAAEGVCLNHIARETVDVERLAKFYQEILGFERIESPKFGEFKVVWMKLPPAFSLHIIQRNPEIMLPEGPWSSTGAIADPKDLPRGHHVSFSVSNYESFVQTLKDKGIAVFEKTQPDGKTKQVFFFDPDVIFPTEYEHPSLILTQYDHRFHLGYNADPLFFVPATVWKLEAGSIDVGSESNRAECAHI